jgi:LDH2 family malate/lactate/ureidoglycolate dehydrogenase
MNVEISELKKLAETILSKLGFSTEEVKYIIENCLEGELTDKKSHGLNRLFYFKEQVENGKISIKNERVSIVK